MSGPYTKAFCNDCDQPVDRLCEEHEELCKDCCSNSFHEIKESK